MGQPNNGPAGPRLNRQVRVAGRNKDDVDLEPHAVLGDDRRTPRDRAELASENAHEGNRQMLGDEDRYADLARQRMEQGTQRVDATGRSANRQHVDRIGRHRSERRRRTLLDRRRRRLDRGIAKALELAERISENLPLNRPVPGLGSVSAAPNASAATVCSAPSSASEETIMTLAPAAAEMIRGIDLRPPAPGISRSSTTMSTRHSANASIASSAVPATAVISNVGSASTIRDSTARATVESSTIISRILRRVSRESEKRSRDLASARSIAGLLRRRRRAEA